MRHPNTILAMLSVGPWTMEYMRALAPGVTDSEIQDFLYENGAAFRREVGLFGNGVLARLVKESLDTDS